MNTEADEIKNKTNKKYSNFESMKKKGKKQNEMEFAIIGSGSCK